MAARLAALARLAVTTAALALLAGLLLLAVTALGLLGLLVLAKFALAALRAIAAGLDLARAALGLAATTRLVLAASADSVGWLGDVHGLVRGRHLYIRG